MWEISWLDEELLASQEALCPVSYVVTYWVSSSSTEKNLPVL